MGHRLPRHTAATLLLLHRAQPLVVSEMLVYASVAFTLTRYGHVLADMRKPARNTIERLFGGAGAKLGAEWRGQSRCPAMLVAARVPNNSPAAPLGIEPRCSV